MATNDELEAMAEDARARGLKSIKQRGREIEMLTGKDLLDTIRANAMAAGLNSPKRGLSVGLIQRPSA